MTSEVEICNIALGNIRSSSINSLQEPSLAAQNCKLLYPVVRDKCLSALSWGFNHSIRPLSVVEVDIFTWAHTYNYPNDCLRINRLISPHEGLSSAAGSFTHREELRVGRRPAVPYEIFNVDGVKLIGANDVNLRVDYRAKVHDPDLFSVDFILALTHLLGAELAIPVVGHEKGRALRLECMRFYEQYIRTAMADDMNEQESYPEDSEFVTIRG